MLESSLSPQSDNPDIDQNSAGALGNRGDIEQRETDILETMSASHPVIPDAPMSSSSTAQDSGLAQPILDADGNVIDEDEILDEDNLDEGDRREIPMTDWEDAPREDVVTSPEMADMSSPGEVDIEALDEDAVNDLLPPDAQLDHLEP